eukprot:TRINITY_DN12560_c0_g1_i1.p1 TRINITY_DN12560_c0_g1~~TRINITY_DN12560_c0_g1_i1.p1  ORF type:complete len:237 (+),score=49.93 TRINITY_DN12560_c0_g1_i1:15-725(+)
MSIVPRNITKKKKRMSMINKFLFGCFRIQRSDPLETFTSIERYLSVDAILPPPSPFNALKKTLVLDLDETLIHSSMKMCEHDFVIDVEHENQTTQIYVRKRPDVDEFLARVAELFEVVIFTASLANYANPLIDKLDTNKVVSARLFRTSCTYHRGNFVKDLSKLGRDLTKTIIIDDSPASYIFHPENAIAVQSWENEPADQELNNLLPFLELLSKVDDVRLEITKFSKRYSYVIIT